MGMFDFIADVGEKLFSSDEDAAENIQKQLSQGMPGMISDLKVGFDDGVVTLAGECDCARTKRVATLTAGNNQGVKAVNADALTVKAAAAAPAEAAAPAAAAEEEPGEYYTIQSGDTLSGIAKKHLGDAMAYTKIFEANREVIKDPNKIYPGQKIFIPKD
ncbi:MAG: LysM peptidoglycan-binding domain-containing protein [Gammaproteobacteria bacterium]